MPHFRQALDKAQSEVRQTNSLSLASKVQNGNSGLQRKSASAFKPSLPHFSTGALAGSLAGNAGLYRKPTNPAMATANRLVNQEFGNALSSFNFLKPKEDPQKARVRTENRPDSGSSTDPINLSSSNLNNGGSHPNGPRKSLFEMFVLDGPNKFDGPNKGIKDHDPDHPGDNLDDRDFWDAPSPRKKENTNSSFVIPTFEYPASLSNKSLDQNFLPKCPDPELSVDINWPLPDVQTQETAPIVGDKYRLNNTRTAESDASRRRSGTLERRGTTMDSPSLRISSPSNSLIRPLEIENFRRRSENSREVSSPVSVSNLRIPTSSHSRSNSSEPQPLSPKANHDQNGPSSNQFSGRFVVGRGGLKIHIPNLNLAKVKEMRERKLARDQARDQARSRALPPGAAKFKAYSQALSQSNHQSVQMYLQSPPPTAQYYAFPTQPISPYTQNIQSPPLPYSGPQPLLTQSALNAHQYRIQNRVGPSKHQMGQSTSSTQNVQIINRPQSTDTGKHTRPAKETYNTLPAGFSFTGGSLNPFYSKP